MSKPAAKLLDRAEVQALLTSYDQTHKHCRTGLLVNDARHRACANAATEVSASVQLAASPCKEANRSSDQDKVCALFETATQKIAILAAAAEVLVDQSDEHVPTAAEQQQAQARLSELRRSSEDIASRLEAYKNDLEGAERLRSDEKVEDDETKKMVRDLILGMHSDVVSLTRPPFDTVVLINPATEALTASMLRDGLDDWRALRENLLGEGATQAPMLVSMTSRGDLATRCGLPFTRVAERFASPATRNDMFGLSQPTGWSEASRNESNYSLCSDALDENWFGKSPRDLSVGDTDDHAPVKEQYRGKGRKQYVYLGKPAAAIGDLRTHQFSSEKHSGEAQEVAFCFNPHCARSDKSKASSPEARQGCAVSDSPPPTVVAVSVDKVCYYKTSASRRDRVADEKQREVASLYEGYLLPKDIVRSHGDVLDNPLLQAMIIHQAAQWASKPLCPRAVAQSVSAAVGDDRKLNYCQLVNESTEVDLAISEKVAVAE